MSETDGLLDRYEGSLLGVFGRPTLVLEHGDGCWVWDVDGVPYLDLLGGIAVNTLGHNHPDLVAALSAQISRQIHISNFFTSRPQIALAERLLNLAGAPDGSRVFFTNSGTEALEAAIKLARRTGRPGIVAMDGAFHGRSTGALALTAKPAYREPFEPLLPGVRRVPYADLPALERALTPDVGAVVLEPIQGEAGVIVPPAGYLRGVRELTADRGVLMILDEVQTGIGRTGRWFAFQDSGIRPDAMTLAKGLGGGIPIGALVTFGGAVSGLLAPGMHGSTFGGNPLAATAGLTVLDVIARDDLLANARRVGDGFADAVRALGHPLVTEVRGRGLLRAIGLAGDFAAKAAASAREAGFLVNAVTPNALRIAPPLIISAKKIAAFVDALGDILDATASEHS
jgi:acetylornithine/N-succinyldiaminopimelate aminotransferase